MEAVEIITEFKNFNGTFPREALSSAIAQRDEVIHELLKIIERAANNIELLEQDSEYIAFMYAIYLLAQFREQQAYPLICPCFSIPGEQVVAVTGDFVTGDLHKILASVSCGDISLITQMAENEKANVYVRCAALQSLLVLVNSGEQSREDVISYYRKFLQNGSRDEDAFLLAVLVGLLVDLYAEEAYGEIKQAYQDDLIDKAVITLANVDDLLAKGKEQTLAELKESDNQLFSDVIGEMEKWNFFQPKKVVEKIPEKSIQEASSPYAKSIANPYIPVKPYIREEKKIGRNDPCSCGSGKKYKKCCGLNA